MRLTSRYVHPTPHGAHCRVRIYLPDEPERDAPVVICSELSNNPGMSITEAAQTIAAEVIRGHRLPTPWCGSSTIRPTPNALAPKRRST
jgi:hypothetical protein